MKEKQLEEIEFNELDFTSEDLRKSIFGDLTREELKKYEDENGLICFGSKEEVEDENHPATLAVVSDKGKHQMVNLSGKTIYVYSSNTLTGSSIGNLGSRECYALRDYYDNQRDAWKINFLNGSGRLATGWYKGTTGCTYWKSKPISTVSPGDKFGNMYGCYIGTIRTYNIKKATKIYDGSGKNAIFSLAAGDLVGVLTSYGCISGQNYPDYMKVSAVYLNKYQDGNPHKSWIPLEWATSGKAPGGKPGHSTGWIDTQWLHASVNTAVRGNW